MSFPAWCIQTPHSVLIKFDIGLSDQLQLGVVNFQLRPNYFHLVLRGVGVEVVGLTQFNPVQSAVFNRKLHLKLLNFQLYPPHIECL